MLLKLKIAYWIACVAASCAFFYAFVVDFFGLSSFPAILRAIVVDLFAGIVLIYVNLFHTNYSPAGRVLLSIAYMVFLSVFTAIFRAEGYGSYGRQLSSGSSLALLIVFPFIFAFVIYCFHNDMVD
jgi:hypothetical protein